MEQLNNYVLSNKSFLMGVKNKTLLYLKLCSLVFKSSDESYLSNPLLFFTITPLLAEVNKNLI